MSRKVSATALRDQVLCRWISRPDDQRKQSDQELFVDELWNDGIRLASSQANHYQHVMAVIRDKTID